MFEQSTIPKGSRRWWTTGVGLSGEALLVAGMALAPMVFPQVIPRVVFATALMPPGAPPPPLRSHVARPRVHNATMRIFSGSALQAPAAVPVHAAIIVDPPPEPGGVGVPDGVPGGLDFAELSGVVGSVASAGRPPIVERPPEPLKPTAPVAEPVQRLVIPGGQVNPAVPVFRPEPLYPPLARAARVSGVVQLIGVIGTDGRMKELRVISGHPLLARAALEAVSRWVYQPTLLNHVPVEVEAPITVTFKLN